MDPEFGAVIAALTRLDRDAFRARFAYAIGGSQQEVDAILRGDARTAPPDDGGPGSGIGQPLVKVLHLDVGRLAAPVDR